MALEAPPETTFMTATDSAAAVRTTAAEVSFSILLAVSFCHLLNDIMQSLLAAAHWWLHRPPARPLRDDCRYGLESRRHPPSCLLDKLPGTARRCGFRRDRIGNFPSRVVARRADGVRRSPRLGAIAVPGRRQFRDRTWPSAGRLHRTAARTDEHCLVCRRGVCSG